MVDVLVVGAGIAGSTAAEYLSKLGYRVMVVDSSTRGRDKPCGGGTSSGALSEFPYLEEAVIHKTDTLTNIYKDIKIDSKLDIYMVNRVYLDRMLAERAESEGAEVRFKTGVKSVNIEEKYVETTSGDKIAYDVIVGADGAASIVRRALGYKMQSTPVIYARAKWDNPDSNVATTVSYEGLMGYAWIFPKGKYVNIGIGGQNDGKYLQSKFEEFIKEYNLEVFYRHGWIIPHGNFFDAPYIRENGVILCGDAAGFINTITGEGIYYALKSGKEVAQIYSGDLDITQYPTFKDKMYRIWDMHKEMEKNYNADADKSIRDKLSDKKTVQEMVEYLFSDKKKAVNIKYSDEDKINKYRQILEHLEE